MSNLTSDQLFELAKKYCLAGKNKRALVFINKALVINAKPEYTQLHCVIKELIQLGYF